jgi:hypothetical protein
MNEMAMFAASSARGVFRVVVPLMERRLRLWFLCSTLLLYRVGLAQQHGTAPRLTRPGRQSRVAVDPDDPPPATRESSR